MLNRLLCWSKNYGQIFQRNNPFKFTPNALNTTVQRALKNAGTIQFSNHYSNTALTQKKFKKEQKQNGKQQSDFTSLITGSILGAILGITAYEACRKEKQASNGVIVDTNHLLSFAKPSPMIEPKTRLGIGLTVPFTLAKELAFTPKLPQKDLYAVGGHGEVLELLSDIVLYLQDPDLFAKSNVKPPKGVLLSGPPGTGKTMLAEALAGHANVPIFVVSASELMKSFVGETEQLMRELFEAAQKIAPCIICIDEIDTLGANRNSANMGRGAMEYAVSNLNQLLTLLSSEHPGVVVVGTTNRVDSLDPALTRPGRFDKVIRVGMPNRRERQEILLVHTKELYLDEDVALNDIAALTMGYSGAKLEALVSEAARGAIRDNEAKVSKRHFDKAFSILTMGMTGRKNPNQFENYLTGIHEAGHALIGHLLGEKLYQVSILKRGSSAGLTSFIPRDEDHNPSKEEMLNLICVNLAGRAAEELYGCPATGSESDLNVAKDLARRMIFNEGLGETLLGSELEVAIVLQEQLERAKELLRLNQDQLEKIIEALLEYDELDRSDLISVLENQPLTSKQQRKLAYGKTTTISAGARKLPPKKETPHQLMSKIEPKPLIQGKNSTAIESKGEKKPIPFTKEQVAQALGISPHNIRKIGHSYCDGYKITFKPSFDVRDLEKRKKDELKQNDVEHFFFPSEQSLEIYKDGIEDFVRYLQKYG